MRLLINVYSANYIFYGLFDLTAFWYLMSVTIICDRRTQFIISAKYSKIDASIILIFYVNQRKLLEYVLLRAFVVQ